MKNTRLNDDAAIYNHKETQTEKEKWNALSGKKKLGYFKDYYLKFVILGIVIIAFAGSFIHSMVTKKDPVFTITIINGNMSDDQLEDLSTEYGDVLGINPQKEEVMIDQSLYTDSPDTNTLSDVAEQKLSVYTYSQSYDILIADQSIFEHYASMGYFMDLSEVLPESMQSTYGDSLISVDNDGTNAPYGILITDVSKLSEVTANMENPVLAVMTSSSHPDEIVTMLSYLFESM